MIWAYLCGLFYGALLYRAWEEEQGREMREWGQKIDKIFERVWGYSPSPRECQFEPMIQYGQCSEGGCVEGGCHCKTETTGVDLHTITHTGYEGE